MKRFARTLSFALALTLALSCAAFSAFAAERPFIDVKSGAWYESAVETVYSEGIMEGKAEGKFEPKAEMTRAELVTVLCRHIPLRVRGIAGVNNSILTFYNRWFCHIILAFPGQIC